MMKKYILIILVLAVIGYLWGCGKKQKVAEELPAPIPMEQISTLGTETKTVPESKTQVVPSVSVTEIKLEPLPPAGPYKPTNQEIQTALKNAGFYTGAIDSKVGPLTKKAIEEFQKANGLEADGKVGPKTWAVLSKYLNPAPSATETKR